MCCVQGGQSPVMITFPDISSKYLRSIDPCNSSDTKRNVCYFSWQYSHILSYLCSICKTLPRKNSFLAYFVIDKTVLSRTILAAIDQIGCLGGAAVRASDFSPSGHGSIPGPGVIRHLGQLSLPSLRGR